MELECTCQGEQRHGVSRSIVRRIGSNLPLDTNKRLYIQLPTPSRGGSTAVRYAATGETIEPSSSSSEGLTVVASYFGEQSVREAKTALFREEEEEGEGEGDAVAVEGMALLDDEAEMEVMADDEVFNYHEMSSGKGKKEALHKISALEGELARLKAQIAVYALAETQDIPEPPPLPPPPVSAAPTPAKVQPSSSVKLSSVQQEPATPKPNMSDVLRNIGSVRLKTVAEISRSPGGTPLRGRNSGGEEEGGGGGGGGDPSDPGSIIAQALRKKFAHRVFHNSPAGSDKENMNDSSLSAAGFDSPTAKLFT